MDDISLEECVRLNKELEESPEEWKFNKKSQNMCVYSRLEVTCDVFNLFSHLIPQYGLNRLERGR